MLHLHIPEWCWDVQYSVFSHSLELLSVGCLRPLKTMHKVIFTKSNAEKQTLYCKTNCFAFLAVDSGVTRQEFCASVRVYVSYITGSVSRSAHYSSKYFEIHWKNFENSSLFFHSIQSSRKSGPYSK